MSRQDRRINILIPTTRRRQYQELADKLDIPISRATAALASIGYDALMSDADTVQAQKDRVLAMGRGD